MSLSPYNSYQIAQAQFDRTEDLLKLDQDTPDLLRYPIREFHYRIPIHMDDGKIKIFRGLCV